MAKTPRVTSNPSTQGPHHGRGLRKGQGDQVQAHAATGVLNSAGLCRRGKRKRKKPVPGSARACERSHHGGRLQNGQKGQVQALGVCVGQGSPEQGHHSLLGRLPVPGLQVEPCHPDVALFGLLPAECFIFIPIFDPCRVKSYLTSRSSQATQTLGFSASLHNVMKSANVSAAHLVSSSAWPPS